MPFSLQSNCFCFGHETHVQHSLWKTNTHTSVGYLTLSPLTLSLLAWLTAHVSMSHMTSPVSARQHFRQAFHKHWQHRCHILLTNNPRWHLAVYICVCVCMWKRVRESVFQWPPPIQKIIYDSIQQSWLFFYHLGFKKKRLRADTHRYLKDVCSKSKIDNTFSFASTHVQSVSHCVCWADVYIYKNNERFYAPEDILQ